MGIKIICENRKARFNYEIIEKYEAGIVLKGSEVKALREGGASLGDAYGLVQGSGVWLLNAHIPLYGPARHSNHDPLRTRKLLMHKHEISRLVGKTREKGLVFVPLKLYFKEGMAKVELALGKSKKTADKREAIKKRESDRQLRRALKQAKR